MEHGKDGLSKEHTDIRDRVYSIQLKQEQELELQKHIRNVVPDAGMLKEGIDKICQDNAKLEEEVSNLKLQIERLQERNQKLEKVIKK